MSRRRRLFTMLRNAVLPSLGSGTIQTRRPRRYPTPVIGWNHNEQGGGRGLSERGEQEADRDTPARAALQADILAKSWTGAVSYIVTY